MHIRPKNYLNFQQLFLLKTNERQLKNSDISGTLYTLRIQYSYTQTQCEDGARDASVLRLTPVTSKKYRESYIAYVT